MTLAMSDLVNYGRMLAGAVSTRPAPRRPSPSKSVSPPGLQRWRRWFWHWQYFTILETSPHCLLHGHWYLGLQDLVPGIYLRSRAPVAVLESLKADAPYISTKHKSTTQSNALFKHIQTFITLKILHPVTREKKKKLKTPFKHTQSDNQTNPSKKVRTSLQ